MSKPDYEPTQEQIRRECEKIQQTWTEYERWRRGRWMHSRPVDMSGRFAEVTLEAE